MMFGIGVAVVVHAAIIVAAHLAPPAEPSAGGFATDCYEPAPVPSDAPAAGGSSLAGGGTGIGAGRARPAGSSFALGPEAVAPVDTVIIWPCCGKGCPSEIVVP
jgi:hypothetical protein